MNQHQRLKGAIYSDSDLTINGKGSLTVNRMRAMRLNQKTAFVSWMRQLQQPRKTRDCSQ